MRFFTLIASLFVPLLSYANEGYTWLSHVENVVHVPQHILGMVLVGLFLVVIGFVYRSKVSNASNIVVPEKGISLRNITEVYGSFIYAQCKAIMGEANAKKYFSFIATLFILILLMNLLGLVPGFVPPTQHLSTTLALGLFVFLHFNISGCIEQGTFNYLKHFAGPLWYMAILIFPIEIISTCVRPVSLALRLQGNMTGDHLVISIFTDLVPFAIPMVFYCLGLLVCVVQAYVFIMLTMVYISMATVTHDHEKNEAN